MMTFEEEEKEIRTFLADLLLYQNKLTDPVAVVLVDVCRDILRKRLDIVERAIMIRMIRASHE